MPPQGVPPDRFPRIILPPQSPSPSTPRRRPRRTLARLDERRPSWHASVLGIDHLETRTMLSATPMPSPIMGPPPAGTQETLNLQLQPGPAGSLAAVAPLIAADGGTVEPTTVPGLYTVQVPGIDAGPLATALAASPAVSSDAPVRMMQLQTLPNDPNFTNGQQWQLNGTWGINAPGAWTVTTGSNGVIVANTDSGVNYNYSDILPNIWLNQAEIPANVLPNLTDVDHDGVISFGDLNAVVNGVKINQGPGKIEDSDGDGIIGPADLMASTSVGGWGSSSTQDGFTSTPGDYVGWNFANSTNTPTDMTSDGHGTFTATEIAEVGNNGLLGTGVAWTAQLMSVAFIDQSGGTDSNASAAIHYAVDHGAKVINASWGGTGTDPVIADAINYADQHGVIIVAAAGNNGANDDTTSFVPASYSVDYPNLISVAATDNSGKLASWSNYGVKTVQLAAPGVSVYSMNSGGNFSTMSGTSMAAPLVTGTIALVESAHPSWSMSQVISAVLDHTTPDPNITGKVMTGGIVNAAAAVANTDGPYVTAASPSGSINGSSGLGSVQVTFNEEINPATFTPAQVTLTGPNGTISGVTVAPVSGSNDHQFTITFPAQTAAGAYKLTVGPSIQDLYGNAMNQNRNAVNGEASDAFVETILQTAPGAGDILSVTGIPSTVTAGTSYSVTVTALAPGGGTDTGYLGTVDFTSTDAQAGLPSQYTFKASDAGVHTFNVTIETAGFQTVTATDTSSPAISGSEENILVAPTTAASLTLTGFPTTDNAGAAQTFTVTAHDRFGNVATGYVGTLHFTSSDARATLPANSTITPEDQGTATFQATLGTLGAQSITATDTSNSSLTASESGITVQPGAAVSFQVAGFPTTDNAGAAQTFTVTALDAYGNIATGYTGMVDITSTDPQATFQPATYTFVTGDDGKHTFTATLKTAGAQSITVTDSSTATLTGSETGIAVQPGALAGLAVTGFPTTATAGTAESFVVSAVDSYGNTVAGYTGTVALSTTDTLAVIQPSSYTFLASDNGQHTFTATFKTAGTQSITATDSASNYTASETGIAVQAAAASTLQVVGAPSAEVAGTAFSLTVTAYDAYGNIATGFADTLNLSSTDPQAVFQPSSHTFTTNDAGTFTFTATLETAGSQTITFTDPAHASLSLTTSSVAISPAAVSAFAVSGFPATVTAGTAASVTVTAVDPYGNLVTGFTGTVALASSDGQAVLPASYTFAASDDGKHTFTVTLKT
ncbi:MAG: S8 family serine peptidase, partial [Isosphaeraceae bacterium]